MNECKGNGRQDLQKLVSCLLDAVKQCQRRFGSRTELATEGDSSVICLCTHFEAVFQHGLRKSVVNLNNLPSGTPLLGGNGPTLGGSGGSTIMHVRDVMTSFNVNLNLNFRSTESEPAFWHFVREFLNRHEQERYLLLKQVTTDIGRGRAWLRSSLNEHSLERYVHMFLSDSDQLYRFYEESAFMRDQEMSNVLPNMAAGLGSILFAINIDNPNLNCTRTSTAASLTSKFVPMEAPKPVIASPTVGTILKERRKKKRAPAQIISFDEDELDDNRMNCAAVVCRSAPPTCLSSPADLNNRTFNLTAKDHSQECEGVASFKTPHQRWLNDALNESNLEGDKISFNCKNQDYNSDLGGSSSSDDCQSPDNTTNSWDHKRPDECDSCQSSVPNIPLSNTNPIENFKQAATVSCSNIPSATESYPCIDSEDEDTSKSDQATDGKEQGFSEDQKAKCVSSKSNSKYATYVLENKCIPEALTDDNQTPLTPVTDTSVGELFPVTNNEDVHSEDSISIPSYSEDTENAAVALALVQKVIHNTPNLHASFERSSPSTSYGSYLPTSFQKQDTLSNDDLRKALLAVMQKRDELLEQNRSLQNVLDKEMDISAGLKVENEEIKKRSIEKMEKLQNKLQALNRENELLKHQLRKYVGAVQMLKRDGMQAHEALASFNREGHPTSTESHNFIDYHFEAKEYEKKLIQVAEMHGELMEFNERLHRLVTQKELVCRRLRDELIDLRGPLPDDALTSDDDISITSDYDTSSMTAAIRALINVWIPSVFLTGKSSDVHHVYQVYIRIRDDEWNIYRRYAQFYGLHKDLKKKDPLVNTFEFPPKKIIGNKDAKFVEERRKRLQHYLRCVVNLMVQNNSELYANPDKETLTSLMPFFGEFANHSARRRNHQRRTIFSRASSQSADQSSGAHYTGL